LRHETLSAPRRPDPCLQFDPLFGKSGAQPELGKGDVFAGNTEQDNVVAGDLAVPEAAPPVP
jgi:hypothetical protein